VRVGYPSAGAQWGHQHLPRIGQEVLVTFIENDIDRPLVTGVIHNGTHNPPSFSGAGSLPAVIPPLLAASRSRTMRPWPAL
jgi:type VI secretion system secreted protein VgrG